MRFFTPSIPAGRLEYLGVMIAVLIAQYLAVFMILDVRYDQLTNQIAYTENRLAVFLAIWLITLAVSWINVLRRLTDMGKSGWLALGLLIPIVGIVLQLYLLVAGGNQTRTYAPFGDDPLNPDSWVAKPGKSGASGPAVTYQGQELRLPGEDGWNSDAA